MGLIKSSGLWSSEKAAHEGVELEVEEVQVGFGIVREGGTKLTEPLTESLEAEEEEFCREIVMGLLERKGEGDEGVDGVGEFVGKPNSFLALRITEWTKASGPNANLIISFSPWSWIRSKPIILEAFSGSKFWILEKTTLVAS